MVRISEPLPGAAVVLDSPHSGTQYPDDFRYHCALAALRSAEDTYVDRLYDFAPELGVTLVCAEFPRSYLDANRHPSEIDPQLLDAPWPGELMSGDKVRLGKGLVWRLLDDGTPIYDRRLSVAEVQRRISECWEPYHAALARALDRAHAQHGYHIHINCHSMPSVASSHATLHPGETHPDFVVGDRDGSTAAPALTAWLAAFLRGLGYGVQVNHPYKGVELVRRYGKPAAQRHSIQLEVNRKLYMDERSLQPHAGFAPLRAHLRQGVAALCALDPRSLA